MSTGRGGPSRERFHRHPPPDLPAKEKYHRPGPAALGPRLGPHQTPYSSYYQSPAPSLVPIQLASPSLNPFTPPIPDHNKSAPKPVPPNRSHNPNPGPSLGFKSFHHQQVEFLRGQSSEAPQFRASLCSGGGGAVSGRQPSSPYQPQSGYSRYPKPNSSHRGRGVYSQDQSFGYPPSGRAPRGNPDRRFLNQNQLRGQSHNQYFNRQWGFERESLPEKFQSLSLHQDRPNRVGESFDRHSASCSFSKVNITLTPDIQDQVQRALAALKPSESISAKLLAKKLRLPKKIINKALYSLERSQKASKQGLLPPEWTLYREHLRGDTDQNPPVQSPPSLLCVSSDHPPEANPELKTETAENLGQAKKEDSDTESSCSNSSSLESSDSEESQTRGKGQLQEKQHPGTTSSPDQDLKLPMMSEQKELVLQYLLNTREATALVIAKNLGLKNTKQVNPTLYSLEKQGDVIKNGDVTPPTWELSTHRRERMERSLKASKRTPNEVGLMELETREGEAGGRVFLPSSLSPPIPGLEPLPLQEGWMPEQSHSEGVGRILPCIYLSLDVRSIHIQTSGSLKVLNPLISVFPISV